MTGRPTLRVHVDDRGRVRIDGPTTSQELHSESRDPLQRALRQRTPAGFWLAAHEHLDLVGPNASSEPFASGVGFYTDDDDPHALAIPPDLRAEIARDTYEAAREAILAGITEYATRTRPVYEAIARIAKAQP